MSKCRVYTLHMAFESGIGEEKRLLGLCTIVILCDILVFSNLYVWITTQHAKEHNIHIYKPCTKRKAFVSTNRNCGQNHKCGCCSM